MTRLTWDTIAHEYEAGLDRGVFYSANGLGEVWNGLVSVKEDNDLTINVRYLDGVKFSFAPSRGEESGVIGALTYPKSFNEHERFLTFGLSYRIQTRNSYKIHLIYNVRVTPTSRTYEQLDSSAFSWKFTSRAVLVPGGWTTSHLIIDADEAYPQVMAKLEDILYGSSNSQSRLPSPEELVDIFEENALLRVIDHGDGTFTVDGPDSAITMLNATTFEITWHTAIYIDAVTYRISSG